MILLDVNVLVYAHRQDIPQHQRYREWLEEVLGGDPTFGISDLALSGFLRVVTNPRAFREPTDLETALVFAEQILSQPSCVVVHPGPRHWKIFTRLCREVGARGKLIPDAYFAALAIELGCEWITADRDFSRFKGLRWRHPLA